MNTSSSFWSFKNLALFQLLFGGVVSLFILGTFVSAVFAEETKETSIPQEISETDELSHSEVQEYELREEGRKIAEKRKQEQLKRIESEYEDYIESIEKKYSDKIDDKRKRLSLLQEKLEKNYLSFDENNKKSKESAKNIIQSEKQINTLEDEIKELDKDIAEREKRISLFSQRIAKKESDIALLVRHKSDLVDAKNVQEDMVLDFFELYQVEDDEFLEKNEMQGMLEILFTDKSNTEEILETEGLNQVEKKSRESFYLLDKASSRVNESTYIIQEENKHILEMKEKIQQEKKLLLRSKEEKNQLLSDTKNSEKKYQHLWRTSLAQMHQAAMEVKNIKEQSGNLNDELKKIEKTMRFEKRIITKERIREKVLDELSDSAQVSVTDLGKIFSFESNEYSPLSWPVAPTKGISAYFHDEGYKKRFKVDHNAIDIPVDQGSDVHSATAGYVYKAVDNGMGYSYIILLHRDNIRTVYGHISDVLVKEGQMVQEGEVIGKSGGQPGTKGAGRLTTGPHLHFEVLVGDKWKNPLEYLPLGELPLK